MKFGYSTFGQILPGQMRVWQNGLSGLARWMEHPNHSQSNPGPQADGSPCNCHVLSAGFAYESFFKEQIRQKKLDHSYRIFKKVNRSAESFPAAREFSWGDIPINVWCSNDYLGMSAHPRVKAAVKHAVDTYGAGAGGTR